MQMPRLRVLLFAKAAKRGHQTLHSYWSRRAITAWSMREEKRGGSKPRKELCGLKEGEFRGKKATNVRERRRPESPQPEDFLKERVPTVVCRREFPQIVTGGTGEEAGVRDREKEEGLCRNWKKTGRKILELRPWRAGRKGGRKNKVRARMYMKKHIYKQNKINQWVKKSYT